MRLIIVGLDGASRSLVSSLVGEGKLPTIGELWSNGVQGELKSTIPCNTCPAMPTLYTGKNPGNTAVFDFIKPDGNIATFKDFKDSVFWHLLGQHNFSSILFGTRLTEPVVPLNGFLIPDDTFYAREIYKTYPEELKNSLLENNFFLDYDILENLKKKKSCEQLSNLLLKNLKNRFEIFNEFVASKKFDFALLWVGHTDLIQHQCWHNEEIIKNFFIEVDNLMGELLKKNEFQNTLIVSDHGFGKASEYNFHLNEWLCKNGYMKLRGSKLREYAIRVGYKLAETTISDSMKKRILNLNLMKSQDKRSSVNSSNTVITPLNNIPGVDWSATIAHATTGKCWGIRILKENLGKDYEEVRKEIIQKLKHLKDSKGNRVIKDAWRGEEIYWGKYQDQVPDVIFLKEDIFRVRPSLVGKMFTKIRKGYGNYMGNHDSARDGIFIAHGPDIKNNGEYMGEVQLYDIAPTILHMYGIPVPEDMDGKVLKEIFKEGSELGKREIRYQRVDQEKKMIVNKIKNLKDMGKM